KYGLVTSAFVNSQNATFGPWPVDEGLCTLEEHRYLPIDVAAKDLFKEGIDTVIISNCYASEEELKKLGDLKKTMLDISVNLAENIPEVEKNIVLNFVHFNRGDVNENLIRSTQSRVKYKGHYFEVFNPVDIKRGDIIIESSLYGHYAGELQIAKTDMKNTGKTNVVGRVKDDEIYLLDDIKPWEKFILKEVK
ncbi:phospho-sugar glycosidase domain-containing protein, partial [Cetobacterium sp.]